MAFHLVARTLNHQSGYSTLNPSRKSCRPSAWAAFRRSSTAAVSVTRELISPLA